MVSTCHPNRFALSRGLCKSCYDKWLKSVNPEYKRRQLSNSLDWRKLHPEQHLVYKQQYAAKLKADPLYKEKCRERLLKRKYGITLADYACLLDAQQGSCKLCFRQAGKFPLHVDHDHVNGKVRGLLCHQCNWYLGIIEADNTILGRIRDYLYGSTEKK